MQAGVELNEIQVSEDVEKKSIQFGKLILESVMIHNPDILITESTIGKYTLVTNSICSFITISIVLSSYSCEGFYYALGQFCDTSYVKGNG